MEGEAESPANSRFNRIYPWFLCGLSFTVQFLVLGFYKGFGSIYVALQNEFQESDALTAWTGSISFALTYMLTPLTFRICTKYGFRITMFVGSILYGLGLLSSSFVPGIPYLYLTFGVLFAIGQSLCFSASILILPEYFTKNWSLAHGIALCGNSIGALALAPIMEIILTTYGFKLGFQMASGAAIYIMIASMFYKRPKKNKQAENTQAPKNEGAKPVLPLKKNKAYITFITGTTLMHFGYYIPFVHLVRMAIDLGVPSTKAALLPGYMALAQSTGKVILGKIATFPKVDKIIMYQVALLANCLATTTCPTITTYSGLIAYAVVFGLQDGCTSANNMLVIGDLVSKDQLSSGYSVFLLTSAASFLLGPPVAGLLYDMTGTYSLAFFFSGGTAALAICVLFQVPIFRSTQGNPDKIPKLLEKKDEEAQVLVDAGTSSSEKDNSKPSSRGDSNEYLHMSIENKTKNAHMYLRAVWNNDKTVLMMPDDSFSQKKKAASVNNLLMSTAVFPLITKQEDLEGSVEPETGI